MMTPEKSELLALVDPILEKIAHALMGSPAGVATYALLTMAVTTWKKTGLPVSIMHTLIDNLVIASNKSDN
jgi:hypothetical protein